MVKGCGCKGARCTCAVIGEGGLRFSGNGSSRLPLVPHFAMPILVGQDSSQIDVTVTGSGTSGDPWVIQMDAQGSTVTHIIYESDDTWSKEGFGTVAQVVVIGGGGGGGSAGPSANAGGSGGSGGAMSTGWFLIDDLPDDVQIKVGTGGQGGTPSATTGGNGGRSDFGDLLYAGGGRGGKAQAVASQSQFPTTGGTPPEGGPGGAGAVRDNATFIAADSHVGFLSPTGGGMGTGLVVTDGNAANPGFLPTKKSWAGQGGDGGNTAIVGPTAWPGDPGELFGGGGGGGASDTGDSWPGGDGASGVVVVTIW